MAEEQLTPEVVDEMIAETIDLVVHLHLDQRSGDRRVAQVAEVAGLEGSRVLTNDLFCLEDGTLVGTGVRPRFVDRLPQPAVVDPWNGHPRR
jgi:Flp pilus assembly CpaF family ATPase